MIDEDNIVIPRREYDRLHDTYVRASVLAEMVHDGTYISCEDICRILKLYDYMEDSD